MREIPSNVPNEYRPLSAWGYVGYYLLYSMVPIAGFILAIVHAFDDTYIARRNFARSYFCWMLLSIIICIIVCAIVFAVLGFSFATLNSYPY